MSDPNQIQFVCSNCGKDSTVPPKSVAKKGMPTACSKCRSEAQKELRFERKLHQGINHNAQYFK